MRKVVEFQVTESGVSIRYDNGDMWSGRINIDRLASLIENDYNRTISVLALTDSEILAQDGYNEYLDETYEVDSYLDGQALASAGLGTDEDYGSYGDDSY